MNKVSDFFIKINPLILPLMQSPFHWLLSSRVMLMRFKGRKSGKQFLTPVNYNQFDDMLLIGLTESHNRNWWKNYREEWPMELCLKGKWQTGKAVWIEPGSNEYKQCFERVFNKTAFMPGIFKIKDYNKHVGLTQQQLDTLINNTSGLVKYIADPLP